MQSAPEKVYCKHMWSYCFDIDGKRATRNAQSLGFYPLALTERVKPNGTSAFSLKAKTANGQVRFGVAAEESINENAWSREQFIFFDGNQSGLNKKSCISHNLKQVGEDIQFLGVGEIELKMEVNINAKRLVWYKSDKLLGQSEIPKNLKYPLHAYFALKEKGDWCELASL